MGWFFLTPCSLAMNDQPVFPFNQSGPTYSPFSPTNLWVTHFTQADQWDRGVISPEDRCQQGNICQFSSVSC